MRRIHREGVLVSTGSSSSSDSREGADKTFLEAKPKVLVAETQGMLRR